MQVRVQKLKVCKHFVAQAMFNWQPAAKVITPLLRCVRSGTVYAAPVVYMYWRGRGDNFPSDTSLKPPSYLAEPHVIHSEGNARPFARSKLIVPVSIIIGIADDCPLPNPPVIGNTYVGGTTPSPGVSQPEPPSNRWIRMTPEQVEKGA